MVERFFFHDLSENRLRWGVFTSVSEFATAIDVRVHSFQATVLG